MWLDNSFFGLVFEPQKMFVVNRRVNQPVQILIYHNYSL